VDGQPGQQDNPTPAGSPQAPLAALRRFMRPPTTNKEACELCSAELGTEHQHLLDPAARQMICACDACAVLFAGNGATKYRRLPRRVETWPEFQLTDAQWDSLRIPINLAYFFHSTPAGRVVAQYPSPAGPTESLLPLEAWRDLVEANPRLGTLEPDVEALLVNRVAQPHVYLRVPIDACYKLVGVIRAHWRGLSGGAEVWKEIEGFFASLRARAESRNSKPEIRNKFQ
jgi:hypothetical protein